MPAHSLAALLKATPLLLPLQEVQPSPELEHSTQCADIDRYSCSPTCYLAVHSKVAAAALLLLYPPLVLEASWKSWRASRGWRRRSLCNRKCCWVQDWEGYLGPPVCLLAAQLHSLKSWWKWCNFYCAPSSDWCSRTWTYAMGTLLRFCSCLFREWTLGSKAELWVGT